MPNQTSLIQASLLAYLITIRDEIIAAATEKGMNASGKTLGSLEVTETANGYDLLANPSIWFMEHGRGPTHPGATAGNPNLVEVINNWLQAKGLDISPYAVAKTIHKSGTRLYRNGGNSGILTVPLNLDKLDEVFSQITGQYLDAVINEVFDALQIVK